MKRSQFAKENGQVVVLLALTVLVLFGIVALAIDGSASFAEHRKAQNAADAAAMAGATVVAQKGSVEAAIAAALERAANNGYADSNPGINSGDVDVIVNIPPEDGPYKGNLSYVQVKITSRIDTLIASLTGFGSMYNSVDAVAFGIPDKDSDYFTGNALVALDPHACKTLAFTGSSASTFEGGGLFSNSDCNDGGPQMSFYLNNYVEVPWVDVVGGAYLNDTLVLTASTEVNKGVTPIPYPPPIAWPTPLLNAACSTLPNRTDTGDVLNPGNYNKGFAPNKDAFLNPGIYCVNSGNLTLNKNIIGDNVLFYVKTGKVTVDGSSSNAINLTAYNQDPFKGLLFFMPIENANAATINGGANTTFTGTFLLPGADVTLNGGGNSDGFNSQVIGRYIDVSGDQEFFLSYNEYENHQLKLLPYIQLVK